MMALLFAGPEAELVRPQARALVADAQAANVAGAVAAGMAAVWFDVTRPPHSDAEVRHVLGLAVADGGAR
jgi:FMN phosphatase YigB (HAD superfamily)